jgi:hypothetical protein
MGSITRNSDMHAKNFSIVIGEGDVPHLAPVYDMMNTEVYRFYGLALKLMGKDRPKMGEIMTFLRSHISRSEIEELAVMVRDNLDACADKAFSDCTHRPSQTFRIGNDL